MTKTYKVFGVLLFGAGVGMFTVTLFAFEPLLLFLEQNFSPDKSFKEATSAKIMFRLYGISILTTICGGFSYAYSNLGFRIKVKNFIIYDPLSNETPTPKKVLSVLTGVVIILVLLSVLGQYYKYVLGEGDAKFIQMLYLFFNLDGEHWVPTTFSSAIIFYCGILLAVIAQQKSKQLAVYTSHWRALSFIFMYLAVDEKFHIHEEVFTFLAPIFTSFFDFPFSDFSGFWVIPAGVLCLILLFVYIPFLIHLPYKYRWLFVLSGGIYVFGAIGFEIVSRSYADGNGTENMLYQSLADIEEFCEMIGMVLFIYTLQSYLVDMTSASRGLISQGGEEDPAFRKSSQDTFSTISG